MRNATIEIQPMSGAIGAEISGVDLAQPLEEQTYREIRAALSEHSVIFFRDQGHITPDQQLAFGKRFGEIWVSANAGKVAGHPQVIELRKEPEDTHDHGGNWHTDQAFTAKPPLGSILLGRDIPNGGDTMFASMYRAYDVLSPGLKKTLEGMRAVHSVAKRVANVGAPVYHADGGKEQQLMGADDPTLKRQAVHPVVLRHPESGRKVLYVNPTYTVQFEGWSVEESQPLLDYLYRVGSRPENFYRFHWRVGSIAFWDNRSCWHFAVQDYDGQRRVMHRVSVVEPRVPVAAAAS